MKTGLVAEARLEAMMREHVAEIKEGHPCWMDPEQLCNALGLRVEYDHIGLSGEGAAFADAIRLDPTAGVPARRRFTFYHEIAHWLLREHGELYSIIHDQYETEALFYAIRERLCNVGAAEFLLPRAEVRAAYEEAGFSVDLIPRLSTPGLVSRTAACAQLAFAAPHACIAVVCRTALARADVQAGDELETANPAVVIAAAFRSSQTKYSCATQTVLPANHLLADLFEAPEGIRARGMAPIPFKTGRHWQVECDALRLGSQVFGFFHLAPPPISAANQLRLPF